MTEDSDIDVLVLEEGAPDPHRESRRIREALRDWKVKRALQLQELAGLKADIYKGLTDLAEGRVQDFNADRIIERGKKLLRGRSPSA